MVMQEVFFLLSVSIVAVRKDVVQSWEDRIFADDRGLDAAKFALMQRRSSADTRWGHHTVNGQSHCGN
jgi:hypothetical protein